MHQRCQTICLLLLVLGVGSGYSVASDSEPAELSECRLLLIESEDAEPYISFRRAFIAEFERLRCGGEAGPDVTRHSIGNQAGLVQRLWRIEDTASYDAIVVQGTIAAGAIRDIIGPDHDRPVFFGNVTDPVDLELIDAFDEPPPHNFTGIAYPVDIRERLRFVRDLFPEDSEHRVRSMEMVHEKLYESPSLAHIRVAAYITELVDLLRVSYGIDSHRITVEADDMHIALDIAVPLGLIINETVSNACKHACAHSEETRVYVRFQVRDGVARLTVCDTGPGFPEVSDSESGGRLGLQLVDALAAQIEGTAEMVSEAGARVTITFPVDAAADAATAPRG